MRAFCPGRCLARLRGSLAMIAEDLLDRCGEGKSGARSESMSP